jgi:hypothetical protein
MDKPIKILMLEDSEEDAGLIRRVLKKNNLNFEYKLVDTKEEFIEGIDQFNPDVILSDHSLPRFNSLEAFEIFKNKNLNIPFILVTGTVSEEFAVHCLKQGIDDYIIKDHLTRLPSALLSALKKRKLAAEKEELEFQQSSFTEKIKVQNKQLIKINRELDQFVYSTSHELRGPATTILGLVYLIQMEVSEGNYEHLEEFLDLVQKSISKLLHTIEEIMNYSSNKYNEVSKEIIDVDEIINNVWVKLSTIDGIASVHKIIEVDQNVPWICDKSRISMIIENITSNAIKYRNRSRKDACIFTQVKVTPHKVLLTIEDNGIGISEKYQEDIFNMFFRGTELSQGPGLGLYLVKETLDKLKGKIKVHSKPNVGTRFKLWIPNFYN